MRPMLARSYGPKFNRYPCFVQPKLNGVRALYQAGVFQSRDELVWHPAVLAHLRERLQHLSSERILDGELYVHGWRLQRINGAVATNRTKPREDTHLVQFHVFDCIDSTKGLQESFADRYLDFYDTFDDDLIQKVETHHVSQKSEMNDLFDHFIKKGYEGIMLRPPGPYTPGERTPSLWKYKHWEDEEFYCVAVTPGDGKASIGIGSLTLITLDGGKKEFQCGTGFTDEERIELSANPPVGKMVKIKFNSKTADGIPVPCVFLAVMGG